MWLCCGEYTMHHVMVVCVHIALVGIHCVGVWVQVAIDASCGCDCYGVHECVGVGVCCVVK